MFIGLFNLIPDISDDNFVAWNSKLIMHYTTSVKLKARKADSAYTPKAQTTSLPIQLICFREQAQKHKV
jgi:hypothetical protein